MNFTSMYLAAMSWLTRRAIDIKSKWIEITRGKDAVFDYHMREYAESLSDPTRVNLMVMLDVFYKLGAGLGIDPKQFTLAYDCVQGSEGNTPNVEFREAFTLPLFAEIVSNKAGNCPKAMRPIVEKYLVMCSDVSQRTIDFNRARIDEQFNKQEVES